MPKQKKQGNPAGKTCRGSGSCAQIACKQLQLSSNSGTCSSVSRMLLHRHSQRCTANTERLWLPLVNRRAQKCTCTSSAKGTSNMQASTYFMQFMPRHTNRGLHGTCELDKMLSGGPKSAGNSHLLACTGPKNGLATPCAVDWGGKTLIPQKAPCPPAPAHAFKRSAAARNSCISPMLHTPRSNACMLSVVSFVSSQLQTTTLVKMVKHGKLSAFPCTTLAGIIV